MDNYVLTENALDLTIDRHIYTEDVLFKCFYWYGKKFKVQIEGGETFFKVKLVLKGGKLTKEEWEELIEKIFQDLIDFKLRDIVTKETKIIRELIIAKAFAYYEVDQVPVSEISDPVGFHPQNDALYE